MHPKKFALIGGSVLLIIGVLALIPNFYTYTTDLPALYVENSYGWFMNLVPMNIFNKIALIVFGAAGIAASRAPATALPASIRWSRAVFGVMGVLTIMGMIPTTSTLFGYWPLFGANIGLYFVYAALGAYFGFALPAKAAKINDEKFPELKLEGRVLDRGYEASHAKAAAHVDAPRVDTVAGAPVRPLTQGDTRKDGTTSRPNLM